MYLATLHVTLDLEPEVAQSDRERVLRALRDRIKHNHGSRVTVRTDDDSAIAVALMDDNLERAKVRLEELLESLDNAGQARILTAAKQVFAWFEGRFQETAESRQENESDGVRLAGSDGDSLGRFGLMGRIRPPKTIVYSDEDEDYETVPQQGRNLGRRGLRIPTRK